MSGRRSRPCHIRAVAVCARGDSLTLDSALWGAGLLRDTRRSVDWVRPSAGASWHTANIDQVRALVPDTATRRSLDHRYGDDYQKHKITLTAEVGLSEHVALVARALLVNRSSSARWDAILVVYLKAFTVESLAFHGTLYAGIENITETTGGSSPDGFRYADFRVVVHGSYIVRLVD